MATKKKRRQGTEGSRDRGAREGGKGRALDPSDPGPLLQSVAVGELIPTPDNPRFIRNDQALAELAGSIKERGVLQPLLARPHPTEKGKFDLRAGARRLAAAKMAKLKTVPVIVRAMDDREALEVTVCENLDREDLHPLEEARGVELLLQQGWSAEQIGRELGGRSAKWVARRASLAGLSTDWQEALLDPTTEASKLPVVACEAVAALPSEAQGEALAAIEQDRFFVGDTPSELLAWLRNDYTHTLKGAPFAADDATLYPEAGDCLACVKRSGCQPLLWDDSPLVPGESLRPDEKCLDPACYAEKGKRAALAKIERHRQQHPKLIVATGGGHTLNSALRADGCELVESYHLIRCKKADRGATPTVSAGSDKVFYTRATGSGSANGRSGGSAVKAKKPATLKEKRAKLELRRQAWALEELRKHVDILEGEQLAHLDVWTAVCLAAAFGAEGSAGTEGGWKRYLGLVAAEEKDPAGRAATNVLLDGVLSRMSDELRLYPYSQDYDRRRVWETAVPLAKLLHIDLAAIEAAAAEKMPEPKSWQAEGAQGSRGQGAKGGKGKRA